MTGVGVLASGQGSNLQALLDAQGRGELGAEVRVVIVNVAEAPALLRARQAGVPAYFVDHRGRDRAAFEAEVLSVLLAHGADVVALAGFMRLIGPTLLTALPDRVLNIHPSLLPAFPGLNAVRQALDYGVRVTGCTVHLVDEGCDTGPILAQAAVPVLDGDDEATLHRRIHAEEHRLYPKAVAAVCQGRVRRQGRRLLIAQ